MPEPEPAASADEAEAIAFGPFQLFPRQRRLVSGSMPVQLGSRAFEILLLLVERAGEVVERDEIFARVWPGLFVDESNLRVHISALRKALGEHRSEHRYITNLPTRGYSFTAPLMGSALRPNMTWAARPENLPARLTPVVGRDSSILAIAADLQAYRFVTITGPGGIGKSTVAVSVAEALASAYPHPVCFIDLGALTQDDRVIGTAAAALGVPAGFGDPHGAMLAFLRERIMLVLLDCCEPVIGAAAQLAEAMLKASPGVHVLATSREPLRAEGERIYRLPPMELPPPDSTLTAEAALAFPAIQLFVDRAEAARNDFVMTDADVPVVAEICRRLDGIPLAIELAATRTAQLGLRDLAGRLGDRFSLLMQGRRTALPRHQTLHATLDWSFQLLSAREQHFLLRLAVLRGVFTFEAAQAIAATQGQSAVAEATENIALLVDKSFLVVEPQGPLTLYRCLDVTRAYLLEKLLASGEAEDASRAHALHFKDLLESAASSLVCMTQTEMRRGPGLHLDNVRAALDWAFGPAQAVEIGVALTVAALPLWSGLSLFDECRQQIERALAVSSNAGIADPRQEMRLFAALGSMILLLVGGGPAMDRAWSNALKFAEQLGDIDYQLRAVAGLRLGAMTRNYREALVFAQRYRALAGASPDPNEIMVGDRLIGYVRHMLGEQAEARALVEGALAHYVRPQDRDHLARHTVDHLVAGKSILGLILWLQGFPDRAMRLVNEAIEEARALEHRPSLLFAVCYAARPVALLAGAPSGTTPAHTLSRDELAGRNTTEWWIAAYAGLERMQHGETQAGLLMLQEAMEAMPRDAFAVRFSPLCAGLAEGLLRCGQADAALAAIDASLARCGEQDQRWFEPELLRIRAEISLALAYDDAEVAAQFQTALRLARAQSALSWELRVATSFARLRHRQGNINKARDLLAPVHQRFTEGFDTADLRAAKALLEQLT